MDQTGTTVYLVRHGTTDLNEKMCFQGSMDEPLNALGEAQGALLEDYFKDIPIDLAVTSPLCRARKTLDLLLGDRKGKIPEVVEPGITEIDGGEMEGRPFREANVIWPGFMDTFQKDPGVWPMPGGETGEEVYNRVSSAICKLVKAHPGKTLVMASHGFAIQTFLNYAAGIPADQMKEHTVDNVAVSKFTFEDNGKIVTDFVGDSHHLKDEMRRNYDWEDLAKLRPVLVWYPKCSTCRKARAFLDAQHQQYSLRHIVEEPLHPRELMTLMDRWDGESKRFFNTSGKLYREQNLKALVPEMDQRAMAKKLATDGMLVKRPLLIFTDKICIGFNEEKWRDALGLA